MKPWWRRSAHRHEAQKRNVFFCVPCEAAETGPCLCQIYWLKAPSERFLAYPLPALFWRERNCLHIMGLFTGGAGIAWPLNHLSLFQTQFPRKDFFPSDKSPKDVRCDHKCSEMLTANPRPSSREMLLKTESSHKEQLAQANGWVYSQKLIKIKWKNKAFVLKERIKCTDTLRSWRWCTDTCILQSGQSDCKGKPWRKWGEVKLQKGDLQEESVMLQNN